MSRDAFGRLLVSPEALSREDRIDCLRQVSGRLQASLQLDEQWVGRGLTLWLSGQAPDIEHALAVRPERGCKRTAQSILRREQVGKLLARLVARLGTVARASAVLRGIEPAPRDVVGLVDQLHKLDAPTSVRTITRYRQAMS